MARLAATIHEERERAQATEAARAAQAAEELRRMRAREDPDWAVETQDREAGLDPEARSVSSEEGTCGTASRATRAARCYE